jgi:hypothetical protein
LLCNKTSKIIKLRKEFSVMKKLLSLIISAAMISATITLPAYAADDDTTDTGTDSTSWELETPSSVPVTSTPDDAKDISDYQLDGLDEYDLSSGVYKLTSDITGVISVDDDVTLYLNGFNITASGTDYAINNEGSLTIIGTGVETIHSASSENSTVMNAGSLTISNCTIYSEASEAVLNLGDLTASDCTIYALGTAVAEENVPKNGYGIVNGDEIEDGVQCPGTAYLTNCKLGGYGAGVVNSAGSELTLVNCDRYMGFEDCVGNTGGNKLIVDNTAAGTLTVIGGFTEESIVMGGDMTITNVVSGKLNVSGGRDVTIEKCVLDQIYNYNAVFSGNITITDAIVNDLVCIPLDGTAPVCNFTNVVSSNSIYIRDGMSATITGCTAEKLVVSSATAEVTDCTFSEVSYYNTTGVTSSLTISGDTSIKTLNAGTTSMVGYSCELIINDNVSINELDILGSTQSGSKPVSIVINGGTINSFSVQNSEGKFTDDDYDILIQGGTFKQVSFLKRLITKRR